MERDVIMRQVRQLAQALARAMLHRNTNQYDEAIEEIDRAVSANGEVDIKRMLTYSRSELQDYLSGEAGIDVEFAVSLSTMLRERANILGDMGDLDGSKTSARLAHSILCVVRDSNPAIVPHDLVQRIESLETRFESD
ncbi:MAG: hypothetical protein HKN43_01555 [Rhodothermales bacterium]|nr:hypothetical protein [Rhodothermales bacterium]